MKKMSFFPLQTNFLLAFYFSAYIIEHKQSETFTRENHGKNL